MGKHFTKNPDTKARIQNGIDEMIATNDQDIIFRKAS